MEPWQTSNAATWLLILAIATTVRQCMAAATTSTSVCSYLCTCTDQKLPTVDCTFTGQNWTVAGTDGPGGNRFVLDGKLKLPSGATALNIQLAVGGHLEIHRDFFHRNIVNHLSIDGKGSRTGSYDTSVELHEGALCNNDGRFPEILVTNVGRLVLNKNISCGAHLLNITRVKDVLLKTEFLSVDEAEIYIQNVNNLQIEANAFGRSTSSKVQIHRTTIESLPKLGASFRLLSFNECNISEVLSHAFDANEVEHVEFVDCRLTSLRQHAVTGRLLSDSLIFRGCYIHRIEHQFVDGSGLKKLLLDSNTINEIAPGAFNFTSVYTIVTGNHIIRTGREWLQGDWVNVTISGNSFGEFNGILRHERKTAGSNAESKVYCYFGYNTITNALPGSFTFGHNCHINAVHFGRECDCAYDGWLQEVFGLAESADPLPSSIIASISCEVEESLRYCFNSSGDPPNGTTTPQGQVNVQYYLLEFCQKDGSKKCSSYATRRGNEANVRPPPIIPLDAIDSLDDQSEDDFWVDNFLWFVTAAAVLVLCTLVCAVWVYQCRKEKMRQTMTSQSSRQGTIRSTSFNRGQGTFTPADRRIIANALRWIRDTYDPQVWSEIDTPVQQLLQAPSQNGETTIDEQEKVRLIGRIIESLNRHDITGDQIVALNDVLYRHLGPPAPALVENVRPESERNDELAHIYDELQPNRTRAFDNPATEVGLLGDYAAPLDHGGITVVPEGIYSEPVLHDQLLLQRNGGNRNLISPYAIGDATTQRNPTGIEGNLPDVILLRPTQSTWKAEAGDDDNEEEDDEDDIDGDGERKTMLRPGDNGDGSSSSGPTYAISMKQLKRAQKGDKSSPPPSVQETSDDQPDGTDGNRSEHSGSSMQTVRIEDLALADDTSERGQFERTEQ